MAASMAAVWMIAASPANSSADPGLPALDSSKVAAWVDDYVGRPIANGVFPGAAVVVVQKDRVVFIKGYGTSDVTTRKPIDPNRTLLTVYSITKLFTAIVALQMLEHGQLSLDRDVNSYLKTFQLSRPDLGTITIKDLLTHRAGFDSSEIAAFAANPDEASETPSDTRRFLIRVRPAEEVVSYDNLAVGLLGMIEAEMDHKSFDRVIDARIFSPLGMRNSIVRLDKSHLALMAACHVPAPQGGWTKCAWPYVREHELGAAAIRTTAADFALFMKAMLNRGVYPGGRLVSEKSFDAFTDFSQAELNPRLPGVGLLAIQKGSVERGDWGHDGGALGATANFTVSPATGTAVFIAVDGGDVDIPLTTSGLVDYLSRDAAREDRFYAAYHLLKGFESDFVAKFLPLPADSARFRSIPDPAFTPDQISELAGWYYPTRREAYAPLLGQIVVPALLPWVHVGVTRDSKLEIGGSGPFTQISPRLFSNEKGAKFGFVINRSVVSMGSNPLSRWERQSLWNFPSLTLLPFVLSLLIGWAGLVLSRRAATPKWKRLSQALAGVCALVLFVALALDFQFSIDLYLHGREWLALLYRVPMQLALLGMVGAVAVMARSFMEETHTVKAAIGSAVFGLAPLVCVAVAFHWGLFGHFWGV